MLKLSFDFDFFLSISKINQVCYDLVEKFNTVFKMYKRGAIKYIRVSLRYFIYIVGYFNPKCQSVR